MKSYEAKNAINGKGGEVWVDGEYVAEVIAFQAKVTLQKEKVTQSGNRPEGQKVVGRECKGTIKMNKVGSFFINKMSDDLKELKTTTATIISKLHDPDAKGDERVELLGCTFDELTLADWEAGKLGEESIPFDFEDWNILDSIADEE